MKSINLLTGDHYQLSAHLFEPKNPDKKLLLINLLLASNSRFIFRLHSFSPIMVLQSLPTIIAE